MKKQSPKKRIGKCTNFRIDKKGNICCTFTLNTLGKKFVKNTLINKIKKMK